MKNLKLPNIMSTTNVNPELNNLKQFVTTLSERFKCPNCSNYLHTNIVQCINGHSFCENCKKDLEKCPLCKERFSDVPNNTLTNVIQSIMLPCKHSHAGCQRVLIYPEWIEHIKTCPHKLYLCPMAQEWQCSWKGPLSAIRNHVFLDHFPLINIRTKVLIKISKSHTNLPDRFINAGYHKFYLVFLLLHNDKVFKAYEVHSISKLRNYKLKFIVECYGAKQEVNDYIFTIEYLDRLTNSICMASANCVQAPWRFARHYYCTDFNRVPRDKNGLPEYQIRVMKKGEFEKGPRKRIYEDEAELTDDEFFEF